MGSSTLDYLSGLLSRSNKGGRKRKQQQTVELKVRMDCDGCELKVKKALSSMKGALSVEVNRKQQKVTVRGYVEANKVLEKAKSTGKKAEIWSYIPFNLVNHPYPPLVYDKNAPHGYVREVEFLAIPSQASKQDVLRSRPCSVMTTQMPASLCEAAIFSQLGN